MKNGSRNPVFAAQTEHRWCMVPQNAGKLPRREWKITLRPQFRTHAATLPAYGMALYASALEHTPTPLCIAGYLACISRWLGCAEAYIRDQIIHLITGELGPLSYGAGNRSNHRPGVVKHGACPGVRVAVGGDPRQLGRCFAARPAHRMAADTTLLVEDPLASAGVSGAIKAARLVQVRKDVRHFLRVQLGIRLILLADLPPHARSMVPQYGHQPAHGGSTGVLSGEIRGNASP